MEHKIVRRGRGSTVLKRPESHNSSSTLTAFANWSTNSVIPQSERHDILRQPIRDRLVDETSNNIYRQGFIQYNIRTILPLGRLVGSQIYAISS